MFNDVPPLNVVPLTVSVIVAPIRMSLIQGVKYHFVVLIPALSLITAFSYLNIVFKLSSSSITSFNVYL